MLRMCCATTSATIKEEDSISLAYEIAFVLTSELELSEPISFRPKSMALYLLMKLERIMTLADHLVSHNLGTAFVARNHCLVPHPLAP